MKIGDEVEMKEFICTFSTTKKIVFTVSAVCGEMVMIERDACPHCGIGLYVPVMRASNLSIVEKPKRKKK